MGAMASESTVHQEWYIPRLAQALREDQRLLDWILFQTLMDHFLWWDCVLQLQLLGGMERSGAKVVIGSRR
jgi:hypothetical protein